MTIALSDFYSRNLANINFHFLKCKKRNEILKMYNVEGNKKTFYECLKIYRKQEVQKFLKNYKKEDLKFIHTELKFQLSETNKLNFYFLGIIAIALFAIYDKLFPVDFLSKAIHKLPFIIVIISIFFVMFAIVYLKFITASFAKEIFYFKDYQRYQLIDILEDLILSAD